MPLPTISLRVGALCHRAKAVPGRTAQPFVGQAYAYELEPTLAAARSYGTSLDAVLAGYILKGLYDFPLRSSILVWYAPFGGGFTLVACEKRLRATFDWLRVIPGYVESGQGYVPQNGRPFVLWDARNVFRLYERPAFFEEGTIFLSDLGALRGPSTLAALEDPALQGDDPFYSLVPSLPDQIIPIGESKYLLRHTWYIAA